MGEPQYVEWYWMLLRLGMAAVAGAVVGQERERRERPAGFRTHVLVSVGACLFTLISISLAGEDHDPSRIAAQIVTGIGFLGAGTIIRHGGSVHGLTTAASIWAVAAVGMAAGVGWWQAVIAGTLLLYVGLAFLHLLEGKLFKTKGVLCLRIEMDERYASLEQISEVLAEAGHQPHPIELASDDDTELATARVNLSGVPSVEEARIIGQVARLPGIRSVKTM